MYNANYMDGVPVKIAEKYKPPPAIYKLPQSLANKLNLEENYYHSNPVFSYDLQLEHKALSKIEQWKQIRQRTKELRKERISRREQQRKREDEVRQKNLLYSVSYPSTDDLSSEEEEEEKIKVANEFGKENGKAIIESKESAPQICVTETANSFHNILQPTVLSFNSNSSNGSENNLTPVIKTSNFESKLSNSFNYKDFEDDTSSPFDNIELKTINDLDVLAQVLHNTQINSPVDGKLNKESSNNISENADESPSKSYPEPEILHKEMLTSATENIPKPNNNLPKFNYVFNSPQEISESTQQFNANLPPHSVTPFHMYNGLNNSNNFYYQNYQTNHSNQNTNRLDLANPLPYNRLQALAEDQVAKSKSVPDILKELRDEIRNSEIRRYGNGSYNIEEPTSNIDKTVQANDNEVEKDITYSQLDSKGKQLVDQISAMGFPHKRVARIVQLVGPDDKKVIEHLIPLSELVDLGFEECKISDALIRNENNKNKALDDLIS